jgi:uncharacterized protein YvpB
LTFGILKNKIDSGIPIIMATSSDHVMVIIGYAYDEELVVFNDPAGARQVKSFDSIKNKPVISFKQVE